MTNEDKEDKAYEALIALVLRTWEEEGEFTEEEIDEGFLPELTQEERDYFQMRRGDIMDEIKKRLKEKE